MGASPKLQNISADTHENLGLSVTVVAGAEARGLELARELSQALGAWIQLNVSWEGAAANVIFLDADQPELEARLAALDRTARPSVFLVVREGAEVPAAMIEGRVDDVLVHPFRPLEVLSRLRHFEKMRAYHESLALNAEYARLVGLLQQDLKLAERLQKQRLPRRFPEVKGFRVTSRYLAGERSGGDYVDLADTRDGQAMAIVMTDASTYRLSSAVLDAVSRRLSNIPADEVRSCVTAARRIRDGVLECLGERDQLSLFYGTLSRKDYRLRFLNLGGTQVFYAPPGKPFARVETGHGEPIVRAMSVRTEHEGELTLEPDGRLVLVSDGFAETAGGRDEILRVLNQHRGAEAADTLNELVFRAKKTVTTEDGLPAQDCTAVLFDVDSRLIRLA